MWREAEVVRRTGDSPEGPGTCHSEFVAILARFATHLRRTFWQQIY